jgi:hypothetical protein
VRVYMRAGLKPVSVKIELTIGEPHP